MPDTTLTLTGRPIPGTVETNLCLKAYALLQEDFDLPPAQMHLHKVVPIGAGLGGGSADAAFALKALDQLFKLNLSLDALLAYARRLGSDCAFFLENRPLLAVEKGDVFEPMNLSLTGTAAVVIYPNLHVSTAEAYGAIVPRSPQHDLRQALAQPMATWRDTVSNDFEDALRPRRKRPSTPLAPPTPAFRAPARPCTASGPARQKRPRLPRARSGWSGAGCCR